MEGSLLAFLPAPPETRGRVACLSLPFYALRHPVVSPSTQGCYAARGEGPAPLGGQPPRARPLGKDAGPPRGRGSAKETRARGGIARPRRPGRRAGDAAGSERPGLLGSGGGQTAPRIP